MLSTFELYKSIIKYQAYPIVLNKLHSHRLEGQGVETALISSGPENLVWHDFGYAFGKINVWAQLSKKFTLYYLRGKFDIKIDIILGNVLQIYLAALSKLARFKSPWLTT